MFKRPLAIIGKRSQALPLLELHPLSFSPRSKRHATSTALRKLHSASRHTLGQMFKRPLARIGEEPRTLPLLELHPLSFFPRSKMYETPFRFMLKHFTALPVIQFWQFLQ